MIPKIDKDLCTGCGCCADVCPPQAIETIDEKAHIDEQFCEECGFCTAACPIAAIYIPFPKSRNHDSSK
jgi:heterodisulfide reductase subunit A-like polyferredoxin